MLDKKRLEDEEQFRSALHDVVTTARKLTSLCNTIDDLVGVCDLALTNDAQLRILFALLKR